MIGNLLILFVLQAAAIQAAVGNYACIEHPAEPNGPHQQDAVSVWRLSLMHLLYRHQRVQRCTVLQGRYGAPSPKPTCLLFVGPSTPAASLKRYEAATCAKGISIGLEKDRKTFQTSKLKEYPSGLCEALSATLADWIEERNPDHQLADEEPTVAALRYVEAFHQQLNVQTELMGPDFNPAARAI